MDRVVIRPSIVVGAIVKELKAGMAGAQLDQYNTRSPVTLNRKGYAGRTEDWTIRWSAVPNGSGGYRETGGILITVQIQRPTTGSYMDGQRQYRLPPNYSDRRFYNAVMRLSHWVREEQHLNLRREGLEAFTYGPKHKVTLTEEDLAAAEATGQDMAFQSMGHDVIEFWWKWLEERYPEAFKGGRSA